MQFPLTTLGLLSGLTALASGAPVGAEPSGVGALYARAQASAPEEMRALLAARKDEESPLAEAGQPSMADLMLVMIAVRRCNDETHLAAAVCVARLPALMAKDPEDYAVEGADKAHQEGLVADKERMEKTLALYRYLVPAAVPVSEDTAEKLEEEVAKNEDKLEEQPVPTPAQIEKSQASPDAGGKDGAAAASFKQGPLDKVLDKVADVLSEIPFVGKKITQFVADRKAKKIAEAAAHDDKGKKQEEKEGSAPSGMTA